MGSGLCARLWAILAVGAASFWILDASDAPKLWRAKSFFSSGPKLPFKRLNPLETCQWFCHNARWSSQLLNSGRWLDCGLWALAALDALLELPLAGLWHTISLFLAVRNGPSGLFLAYRLLHVLLFVLLRNLRKLVALSSSGKVSMASPSNGVHWTRQSDKKNNPTISIYEPPLRS